MKKYLFSFLKVVFEILIGTLILTLFSYFDLISNNVYNYLELIVVLLILYFNGKKFGSFNDKYSFVEGIKLGSLFLLLFVVINVIFIHNFSSKLIIYYIIVLLISILGSMKKSRKKFKRK